MTIRLRLVPILVGILFSPFVFASTVQGVEGDTNRVDGQGRRQGKWILFGKDHPNSGYPAEGKIEEGNFKDNRREGFWIKYYNDGVTPRSKGNYKNNRPSGEYTKLYPDGTIRETGYFDLNKYKGTLKRYHPNGVLSYEANYNDDGKEQGTVKYYYANGKEEFVYEAQNGVSTGKAVRYYENGDVKEIIFYAEDGKIEKSEVREPVSPQVSSSNDLVPSEQAPKIVQPKTKGARFKPNGYNKVYNENDEIWQDGEFKNSRLWNGKVYEYDSDGILLRVKVFREGVYHSDGQL